MAIRARVHVFGLSLAFLLHSEVSPSWLPQGLPVQKPRGLKAEAARRLSHIQRAICLPLVTTHVDWRAETTLDARFVDEKSTKRASNVVEKRLQPESLTRIFKV